jgi:hypothetical protein
MKKGMINMAAIVVLTVLGINISAQPPQSPAGKGERVEALRIAFISQRLNLTPEEAERFWPIYNQYHGELKTLRNNFGMGLGKSQLTAEQSLDFEQKKLDLKKKYKAQFEIALGKEKLNTLYNLEEEFRKKLQELREERQQNRGTTPSGRRF